MAELVSGIFSCVGRVTEPGITEIRNRAHGTHECYSHLPPPQAAHHKPSNPAGKARSKSGAAATRAAGADAAGSPASPGAGSGAEGPKVGELERAIQERLRLKAMLKPKEAAAREEEACTQPKTPQQSHQFQSQGYNDGVWSSKFTAGSTSGALLPWRVEPGKYTPKYVSTIPRAPAWDIQLNGPCGPHRPKRLSEEAEAAVEGASPSGDIRKGRSAGWSLTALDDLEEFVSDAIPCQDSAQSRCFLAPPRPDFWKAGRAPFTAGEISCVAQDMVKQDIITDAKARYPHWDFAKLKDRPAPYGKANDAPEPGKYDVPWGNGTVSTAPRTGIPFDRGLSRAESYVGQLGHGAPIAALHAESTRNPGVVIVPDRSSAKDILRIRVAHVNDFGRDLGRYGSTATAQIDDVQKEDMSEEAVQRIVNYNAITAELPVKQRKDIARSFAGMSRRGKDAVQGVRALQADVGLRGSVGLAMRETESARFGTVEGLESRAADGARERGDKGPNFAHYSGRYGHDSACVPKKFGSLRQPKPSAAAFERRASAPGFTTKAALGGRSPVAERSRSCAVLEALPDWDAELRASNEE